MALTQIDDRGLKTPIDLLDNEKIRLGTGNDLELYHNGTHTYLNNDTGTLVLQSDALSITNNAGNSNRITSHSSGEVKLYYSDSAKLETTNTGVSVTGGITASAASTFNEDVVFTGTTSGRDVVFDTSLNQMRAADNAKFTAGSSADLEVYHNGADSFIDNYTGALFIRNNVSTDNGGNIVIQAKVNEDGIIVHDDGPVELFYDNNKKLETATQGIIVKHTAGGDDTKLNIVGPEGYGGILNLIADDGDDDGDHWRMYAGTSSDFYLQNYAAGSWETSIDATGNGNVRLMYDNVKKFETTANGATVSGNNSISMDASANGQFQVVGDGYTGAIALNSSAMHIYHNSDARDLVFGLNETEKVRILAGGGMTFNGDTATANALDDYEEGTWTPTFQYWDGSAYQDVTFDDALNYTTGKYVKIGNLVHIWYYTGGFSPSDSLDNTVTRISGLPFDFKNSTPYYGGVFNFTHTNCFKDDTNTSFDCHSAYGQYNSSVFYPSIGNSTAQARWNAAANRYLMMGGTYHSNT